MDLLRVVAERNLAQVERILRGLSGGDDAPEPLSREDLAARLAEGSVTVLDIRPPDEYAAGHIPGAVNAMLADLERIVASFTPGREIVAYCRGPYCIYAHQAVTALRKRGLNARRMDGGLPEWREDGREVETVLDGG
jgi:ArsR family transcriptional regulator